MKLKKIKLATLLTFSAVTHAAMAAPVEYKIPASQEEFDAMWTVVPGTVDGTWTWVDDDTPYAWTQSVAEGETGATLIINEPISMKAGDTYYLQAKVSSDHYNNDVWFYIVYGTDKDNLVAMKDDTSTFKCWGKSGGGVNWTIKPTDSSSLRELKITEDGDYYIGIRSKKSSPAQKGQLCVASIYAEKSVNYPGAVTSAKAAAIPECLGAALTWTWPSKNRDGSAIEGELSANIYRSTSNSKNDLYTAANLVGTVTGGMPGEAGAFNDDEQNSLIPITEPGKYYYYVAPFNEAGENSSCSPVIECKWVGEETQFQPILNSSYYPAKATMIDEHSVEISFIPRKDAVNGGWFDESKLCLKVTRQLGSEEPVVVTDNAPMESPYIDNTLSEPGLYTYRLSVVYKGADASSETKLDPIFAGGTLSLPFSEDFTESNSLDMFNILSTNSSYKWTRSYNGYLQYSGYSSGKSVLATAPVRLEAEKTYHVSCVSWIASSEKTLSIVVGSKADIDEMKSINDVTVTQKQTDKQLVEAYYSPNESGIYYFGFYAEMSSSYIYLDDVCIEETVASPAAVNDLSFVPDAAGALKSTISFTIPSTTNAGQPLDEIDMVKVMRFAGEDTVLVKEIKDADCIPGAAVSFEDAVAEAGMYSYSVVSALGEYQSEEVRTEDAWVGYDIPKSISSFTIRAEINSKGGADIRWSGLSGSALGKNGGFVDADNLKYRIYRIPHIYSEEPQIAGETSDFTFADAELADADWDRYSYGIAVVNGPQEGETVVGNAISGGLIDAVACNLDFSNDDMVDAFEGRAFVADNGIAFKNRGETAGQEYMAYLPAFKINDATGSDFNISMILSRDDAEYEEVLEVLLCTIETEISTPEAAMRSEMDAVVIPGAEQRVLQSTFPIRASFDNPAEESFALKIPAKGTYRLALRCASDDNKGLRIHSLSMVKNVTDGIADILNANNSITIDKTSGLIILPENTAKYNVFRIDGTMVATGVGSGEINVPAGMYIVRAVTVDGNTITAKITK